ncbi:IclR family transcriptional regulator [Nocardioides pantholopis]|uniref:IclR family transcriptional regulator n=1 Tax=Nocardioides pantholopis TaxID=2483798 RepID=UPI000F088F6B|nr:IclR family transcriptional regulator C-terminal domain-containing protein [Nocardioides pantholopis]
MTVSEAVPTSAAPGSPPAAGSINRTLRVLAAVCEYGPASLGDLATVTGLTPSTLLRTLRLIRDQGFARQDDDKRWRATLRPWQLGCAVNDSIGTPAQTDRVLRDLVQRVDETAVYAAYEDGWLTYSGRAVPDKRARAQVPLGGRYSALETRTGHAVLAFLPRGEVDRVLATQAAALHPLPARRAWYDQLGVGARRGFAVGAGRHWPGVWAAAAPVFDQRGRPVGAIGVAVPIAGPVAGPGKVAGAGRPARGPAIVREVVAAAHRLTLSIGGPTRPPPAPLRGQLDRRDPR